MKDKVALKSGYYFMVFDKEEIPFFDELEKTNQIIEKDNQEYNLYRAPTWELAQKVDALMDSENIGIGYSIDDYLKEEKINI